MKMLLAAVAAACLTATAVDDAAARTIYRCGPDGKTFSQTPCMDGQLHELSDPRTAAQKAEAKRIAERERQDAAAKAAAAKASGAADAAGKVQKAPKAGDPGVLAVGAPKPAASAARP